MDNKKRPPNNAEFIEAIGGIGTFIGLIIFAALVATRA